MLLIAILPGGSVGLAVIILTLIVKGALLPLTYKTLSSQIKTNSLQPEINAIKEKVKDKVEQNKQIMALYKEKAINPFSGCLPMLIQLPVIIALYWVFLKGFGTSTPVALYSFVPHIEHLNMNFLGFDLTKKSLALALTAGFFQFVTAWFGRWRVPKQSGTDMQAQMANTMQKQTIFIFPLLITFVVYRVSAAVALYWVISNIVTIGQEVYVAKKNNISLKDLFIS